MPTMHLTTAVFDPGTSLEGKGVPGTTPPSTDPITAGAKATQTADKTILDTTTTPPTQYNFVFWIIDAGLYFTATASFTVPAHDFWATAWYIPIGGNGTPKPVFSTLAFTTDYGGRLLPNTPIKMVTPSSAWTSPSNTVATNTSSDPVVVTALSSFGGSNGFLNWWVYQ